VNLTGSNRSGSIRLNNESNNSVTLKQERLRELSWGRRINGVLGIAVAALLAGGHVTRAVSPASIRVVSQLEVVTSVRQAAAACNVTPPVVRRWLTLGLIPEPPWTKQQLHQVRDESRVVLGFARNRD
jgi:hypothetical protein